MALTFRLPDSPNRHEQEAVRRLQSVLSSRDLDIDIEIEIRAGRSSGSDLDGAHLFAQSSVAEGLKVRLQGHGDGVLYAVYGWLERQGWSFHLSGDIEPAPDQPINRENFCVERRPRFAWRGLQLWNYWWPGRDSWGFEDYALYLDQFPKLGLNQLDFPLYWYEPLFTGVAFAGAPMRRLPLSGVDVALARVGASILAGRGRFTSPDIPEDKDDDARWQGARDLLRRILDHARKRGLRTVLGVEIANVALIDASLLTRLPAGDLYEGGLLIQPSSDTGRALARARLKALFECFPDADVYAIWQSEMGVWRSTSGSPHPEDVAFRQRYRHYADQLSPGDFDQLQWLRMAADIAAELHPSAILSTGGWGSERLMIAADEILPSSMIRSTIADYEPAFGLRRNAFNAYEATKGPKAHTTWAEVDQHLWIQQPKLAATMSVLEALEQRGVESVSMLHWRLLFPDPDLYAFAHACWDTKATPETLRRQWAEAKFGTTAASAAAEALLQLERFNDAIVARTPDILHSAWWVGFDCHMGGLLSANRYIDGLPLSDRFFAENVDPLLESADEALGHLDAAAAGFDQARARPMSRQQARRLEYWANRARYSRDLYRAHIEIAKAVKRAGSPENASDFERALAHIEAARAEQVVRDFAHCLGETDAPERGELGLLLSLNIKFLGSVKRLEGAIRRLLAAPTPPALSGPMQVRAGQNLPRREYATFFELLHVATCAWNKQADLSRLDQGFDYAVQSGGVGRLSPTEGIWSHPEELVIALTGPAGWRGLIELYFYQELDWDAPFRLQEVFVGDVDLGRVRDFHGRGKFHDEGIGLSAPICFPASGTVHIRVVRRGGGDARLSAIALKAIDTPRR